eukprot:c15405_g1_i1 orf=139-1266(+)
MREQVPAVLPPPEKRKASISLGKREESREPISHVSRESKKWMVFEGKIPENLRVVPMCGRDHKAEKKPNALLPSLPQKTLKENSKGEGVHVEDAAVAVAMREEIPDNGGENGDLGQDKMMGKTSSAREGAVLLQWGQRKRPRCSRADNHLKHSSLTDESSVLSRKTVRVKAEKVLVAGGLAPKGALKVKNGVRERPRLPPPIAEVHAGHEEGKKRARGGASELCKVNRGIPSEGIKGACSNLPVHNTHKKNPHIPHQNKVRPLPDHCTASPGRSVAANGGGIEITATRMELDWPKFLISLSRKEKEDDFLILKGSKLPQRPKRRPKAVERALHFCTPGTWLSDLSRGRYDVREKKCMKKKPRGLKAMESMDSDSE